MTMTPQQRTELRKACESLDKPLLDVVDDVFALLDDLDAAESENADLRRQLDSFTHMQSQVVSLLGEFKCRNVLDLGAKMRAMQQATKG